MRTPTSPKRNRPRDGGVKRQLDARLVVRRRRRAARARARPSKPGGGVSRPTRRAPRPERFSHARASTRFGTPIESFGRQLAATTRARPDARRAAASTPTSTATTSHAPREHARRRRRAAARRAAGATSSSAAVGVTCDARARSRAASRSAEARRRAASASPRHGTASSTSRRTASTSTPSISTSGRRRMRWRRQRGAIAFTSSGVTKSRPASSACALLATSRLTRRRAGWRPSTTDGVLARRAHDRRHVADDALVDRRRRRASRARPARRRSSRPAAARARRGRSSRARRGGAQDLGLLRGSSG